MISILAVCVLVGVLLRWSWLAMKRSDDPAVQATLHNFSNQVDELRCALIRLLEAWRDSLAEKK